VNLDEIEQEAQYLLVEYSNYVQAITVPPIPVDKIADLYLELEILYEALDADTSGSIDLNKGLIKINQNEPLKRQRFSMGHEMGHYRLHRSEFDFQTLLLPIFIEEATIICRKNDASRREMEANVFSAALIMPIGFVESVFQNEIRKFPKKVSEQLIVGILAGKFDVSKDAMSYRLKNLGCFERLKQSDLFDIPTNLF